MTQTFLTKKETAEILRVSPASVDRYRKQKKISSIKVGRRILFERESLLNSIKEEAKSN